jgi:hypothetical protein
MTLENGVYASVPSMAALKQEHLSTGVISAPIREPELVAAFVTFGTVGNPTWGNINTSLVQSTDNSQTADHWQGGTIKLHGVQVRDAGLGLFQVDDVPDGIDPSNAKLTFDVNCSDIGANWFDDLFRFDAFSVTQTFGLELQLRDTYVDEQTASEGFLDVAGTEYATAAVSRVAMNLSNVLNCVGGSCTTDNFDAEDSTYAWPDGVSQAWKRPELCPHTTEVRFPDPNNLGAPSRIPAFVLGQAIRGFDFGG